jgi:LPXTG-motif cell wall-anchored protein
MQDEKPTPKTEEKEQSPATGDEGHPLGWMMVAILGISGLIAGTRRKI